MSPTVRPRADLADATPAQLAAWERRLELDEQVRTAAATVVESRMPAAPAADDRSALVRAGLLAGAAGTVVAAYVGLPLALAARALLGALPQALVFATAVVVLGTVAVVGVLRRTAVELHPRAARRHPTRAAGQAHTAAAHAAPAYTAPAHAVPAYGVPQQAGPQHTGPRHGVPVYGVPQQAGPRHPGARHGVAQHAVPVGAGPGPYGPHAPAGHAPHGGPGGERPGGRHHAVARPTRRARHGGAGRR